ncbi:uncharacterized protein LOC126417315 [Schistocerca serialis cubense]|uniref:uncharacterized protein LOC126417315 n=1 Tax=Schistocerca serialis cubense TaxID=2023355 RepID=UPI00214E790E|nr:uncharacterized protein LOC126417315 [Schistocerca serialis cubense]XP_049941068.1 uncharacterized protein LOC126417315 [Schistocerca serialis cubense]XP_049941069.1 uncharacterized protein LOC126417315 [Schistocerca serialis cubense]
MPHNVCVCRYHANFNFIIEAIHKEIASFPATHTHLMNLVCCDVESEICMTSQCKKCIMNLHTLIDGKFDLCDIISWRKWTKHECHPKQTTTSGTLCEALSELQSQLKTFKEHFFVKRMQSGAFKTVKASVSDDEVILQLDFAENYAALAQDEIQSAHWSHTQITVVTICVWMKTGLQSFAIVSDELCHDKYSVYACLKSIISKLKQELPNLTSIQIFSDGCAGQFKNKFTISNLWYMMQDFGVSGEWFLFATSHGKSAVDGIGAVTKRAVWNKVKQRKVIISNAQEFLDCAKSSVSGINFLLLIKDHIDENRDLLDGRWKAVKKIKDIRSKHYFNGYNTCNLVCGRTFLKSDLEKVEVFPLSLIYTDSEMSDEESYPDVLLTPNSQEVTGSEPAVEQIMPGTFILVEFQTARKKSTTYRYAAIAQRSVEDNGEI